MRSVLRQLLKGGAVHQLLGIGPPKSCQPNFWVPKPPASDRTFSKQTPGLPVQLGSNLGSYKRIKSLCGAKPPQKLRWTNVGRWAAIDAMGISPKTLAAWADNAAQPGRPGGYDRSIAVAIGAFKTIGSVIWTKAVAVGCVGGRRSPWRNGARDSKTERLRRRHTVLIMAPWPGAVSAA